MHAIILSVGDELVLGQTVDTNSAWLSQQLAALGIPVIAHITVADDQAAIEQAIVESAQRAGLLLISGGIGPTPDDLTRQALAAVMGVPLELDDSWLAFLKDFFAKRNRTMPDMNQIQAMIPEGAQIIRNSCGTAAGIAAMVRVQGSGFRVQERDGVEQAAISGVPAQPRPLSTFNSQLSTSASTQPSNAGDTRVFVMPGVPREMFAMFSESILPELRQVAGGGVILSRTLHTFGLGESNIAEMLGVLMNRNRNPSVGTTVSNGIVSLRINSKFHSRQQAQAELEATESACRAACGDLIFGADEQTLPQAVAQLLLEHPQARQWAPAVCTAESCTGGLLAKLLTDIPGSSAYFRQGWVTYHNEAKENELGVQHRTLEEHGAVSEPVVLEMARGAAHRSGTPFAMAISGIAGPGGGTPAKPVGTVCIAITWPGEGSHLSASARTFLFSGDRDFIRLRSAYTALTMLRFKLLGKLMPF